MVNPRRCVVGLCEEVMPKTPPGELAEGWISRPGTRCFVGGRTAPVELLYCPEHSPAVLERLAWIKTGYLPPEKRIPKREFPDDPKPPPPQPDRKRRPWESGGGEQDPIQP